MKILFLLGLILCLSVLALTFLLRSESSRAAGERAPARPPPQHPPRVPKLVPGSKAPPHQRDPEMEAMRQMVRRYVAKNPGLTAQVMQGWVKNKKPGN